VNNIIVVGFGIAGALHLLFAGQLAWSGRLQHERSAPAVLFIGALLASALWATCSAFNVLLNDRFWPNAAALLDLLRYGLWFAFLLVSMGASRATARSGALPALRFVVTLCLLLALVLVVQRAARGEIEDAPGQIGLLSLLALPVCGALLLEQLFRNLGEDMRWNAKPLCLGLGCIFAFDVYLYSTALLLGHYDGDALDARGAAHLLSLPFLLVASRRSTNWIARLQVSRAAAFHSATLVLAGAYLLFISSIGYYVRFFGGEWGRSLQVSIVFGAVAILVAVLLSASLRARLKVFVGKHFFSYRFDYREEWLRFTAMLSTQGSAGEVGPLVIRALANIVECPAGSLWTRSDGPFQQTARWNGPPSDAMEPADSAFCAFLRDKAWVIDLDQFKASPRSYGELPMPTWLLAMSDLWLVVPLQSGHALLGFVLLARPRTAIDIDWEVLDLLKTASRQAAGYLAQMQATEALLEARKFDAFNRMSAFVVHDLKNIVTQLSLMLKNAERLHDNREFQQDMLLTVESSLEKMRRLMLQLREGAQPPGGSRGVELSGIVARLQALAAGQGRRLDVARLERLATRGHEDRLERVLGHLVQNALDATPAEGRVWVEVERYSGQVRITIGDTGMGMTEDFVQTRLFKPFSTTKGSGMGVGSYESSQYIRELGGSLTVSSHVGKGTVITALLPLFESQLGSDLLPASAGATRGTR
jgi:putative PEP-CTERM system histidine kinase